METSEQLEERKPKTVRVRKRVAYDPDASEVKRTRVVKITRNIVLDPLIYGPVPGSLEEDFLLEKEGDPRAFLKVTVPSSTEAAYFGPRYYQEGRLVPYSVVGPPDLFERQHTCEMKNRSMEEKGASETGSDTAAARRPMFMSIRKVNKTPSETPEQRFQLRQQKVEEGKKRDAMDESTRLRGLPIGLKLVEERQRKCLREFISAQMHWEILAANLAAKAKKPADLLVLNQHQLFREKLEEMDYLDRALTAEEKAGPNGWYMSLRASKAGNVIRGGYLPVGNLFSGIYAQVRERTMSAEAMIRRPLLKPTSSRTALAIEEEQGEQSTKMGTSRKTFRDYPYFQKRMKEEEMKKSLHPVQATNPQSIWLQGESKYEAELRAMRIRGLDQFRIELLKTGELTEEVLAEHYDVKFKY